MENEIWKPINGYETYEVSSIGRVKSLPKKRGGGFCNKTYILSLKKTRCGYLMATISNGKIKCFTVHRLVALTFIDNINNKKFVNHINGIKSDNRVENLEWVTHEENTIHAIKTGLTNNKGENNPSAKLNKKQVIKIYNSKLTAMKLSLKYNISIHTINSIRQGAIWKSITQKL